MRYFYDKPDKGTPLFGKRVELNHPGYRTGTQFVVDGLGMIFVQQRIQCKYCYWDALDYWLANDIYMHPKFKDYVREYGTEENYPIVPVRKVMWALRMKPLPKEPWEEFFGR